MALNGSGKPEIEHNSIINGNHDDNTPLIEDDLAKEVYEDSNDNRWGWCNLRHNCLQVFNSSPWLCVTLSTFMFVQGMIVSGFVPASVSTIECRFELPSTATGVLLSCYDLAAAICVLFVSFYGNHGNKPRILGICAFVVGLGCCTWTLPHYLTLDYTYGKTKPEQIICGTNTTTDCADAEQTSLSYYFIVFVIAQVLIGCGASPLYSMGTSFLDENVAADKAGLYLSISYGFSALGPACGLLLGGAFLTIYTDLSEATHITITPEHPAWVGAWWLGFFIGWISIWCVAIPMSGFPRELKGVKQMKTERELKMLASSQGLAKNARFGTSVFQGSLWTLLRNPTYLCITGTAISEGLLIGGFTYFMPKFVENQFDVTAAAAAALCGIAVIPGAAGGTFLGGWFIKKFKLTVPGMIKFSIIVAILTLLSTPYLLLNCPEASLAGVYVPYEKAASELMTVNLTHGCNVNCDCSSDVYSPVCGNGLVYFDPCAAGCTDYAVDGQIYYNCQCIPQYNCTLDGNGYSNGCVSDGKCDNECWTLPIFLTLFFLSMLVNFQLTVPATAITLRSVPENQRMFALGFQSVCARLFGAVPGLIIIGASIDSTCLVWQERCGITGACWVYDTFQFSLRFFILAAIYLSCTIIFLLLALVVYRPPPCKDHDDDDDYSGVVTDEMKTDVIMGYKTKYRNGASDVMTEAPSIVRVDSHGNLINDDITLPKVKAEKDE